MSRRKVQSNSLVGVARWPLVRVDVRFHVLTSLAHRRRDVKVRRGRTAPVWNKAR